MSERFKYRFEDGWDVYYDRKSFPSGMTCEIAFDTESRDRELFVFPSLVTSAAKLGTTGMRQQAGTA